MRAISKKRLVTLLVVFAVIGGGMAAFAGSATAATTTLAGDDTDEITGFNASADDDIAYGVTPDGTDFSTDGTDTVYMNVSYDGTTYATNDVTVSDGTATTQTVNVTLDALSDLPGDAGQTTSTTVTVWGENASGDVTTATESFSVDFTFDGSHASVTVDDSSATIEDGEAGFFSLNTIPFADLGDDPADLHTYEQTVGIDGDNTTVTVNDATTNGTDAFDDAMGDKSSGDLIYSASASVEGTPVLAFYESADTEIVNESTTYAVYDGGDTWTFNIGSEHADKDEVDVFVSSQSYTSVGDFTAEDLGATFFDQADLGKWGVLSNFGFGALTSFNILDFVPIVGMLGNGGLLLGMFVVSRRRQPS